MRKFISVLLTWAFTTGLVAEKSESPSYVTCTLSGQLGNQLFQIATTLAYAWDYNAIPVFPDLNQTHFRLSTNRDQIFFRLNSRVDPRIFTNTFTESFWNSSVRPSYQRNVRLNGFFCSWVHFHHHRDKLLEVFAPSDTVRRNLTNKYRDLVENPNTVSIHVRTFNLKHHNTKMYHFLGMEYYRKAVELFPEDTVFVVFSDRINWCKQHFPSLKRNFVFIEGDPIHDLFLMSMMKHHIISNSTFSWWAAYLNKNQDSIVVTPTSWHHPDHSIFPPPQPNQFYFDHWTVISPDYNEPYPYDMTWYDAKTQSLDGN
jgi:hypothetical protein